MISDILPLAVASALGFLIGWERERGGHYAGMRTNALVCLGATAFVMLSLKLDDTSQSRVLGQVASGLGFISGGVILKESGHISGLTTAATIWISGAVGATCGTGRYIEAFVIAALAIVINLSKGLLNARPNNNS